MDRTRIERPQFPWLPITLFLGAAVFLVLGFLPLSWLRPLGTLVRRVEDVTPARYARYRHVCLVLAAFLGLFGVGGWRFGGWVRAALAQFFAELRAGIRERPRVKMSWIPVTA